MLSVYSEMNTATTRIANLASEGLTDKQISKKIGFSFRTVYRYRRGNGIKAGRYQRGRKPRATAKNHKCKFLPLDKLVMS